MVPHCTAYRARATGDVGTWDSAPALAPSAIRPVPNPHSPQNVYFPMVRSTSTPRCCATRGCRADYNVLVLAAPAHRRRARARPVRDDPHGGGHRSAAAPAVLGVRDPARRGRSAVAASRCSTSGSAPARPGCSTRPPGDRLACSVRSAGRSRSSSPPAEAWMVAGGVGLAPFATLAEALRGAPARTARLFYGGRSARGSRSTSTGSRARGVASTWPPRTAARGEHGRVTAPLDAALRGAAGRPRQ